MDEKEEVIITEKDIIDGKAPSMAKRIEGVGTVYLYGTWDAEKLITRLLQEESITG